MNSFVCVVCVCKDSFNGTGKTLNKSLEDYEHEILLFVVHLVLW